MTKIITSNEYPPIPYRCMDWCAYYDGTEEEGCCGFGETEKEALDDLENTWPLEDYKEWLVS